MCSWRMIGLGLCAAIAADVAAAAVAGLAPAPTVLLQRGGKDQPYADARSAVADARAGDVVLLGPGTHRGPLALTNANVTLRGVPGAVVNANDRHWKPQWSKAPQYGRRAFVSPVSFEPGAVSIDDRIMIDARESRDGMKLHDGGLSGDSRMPVQGVYTYLAKERLLVVSFADDRSPADHRIEASPNGTTAIAVRGADACRVESLIVTGGDTGIAFEHTTNSVAERCLVYSVDTCVRLGPGASLCKVLSCDLTMNPDSLSLDCEQMSVGKAVWHAHKWVGTYDKRCVLAAQSGTNNEVAFNYLYNMWDGVDIDTGVGKADVEEHYKNTVFKGIARFNRGLKVHHNRLDLAHDDALEPGDELVDNQWYANFVTRARCAVRFKTISLGPFYFYDNVVLDSGNGLRLYKSSPACATVYIFNNVVRHRTGIIYLKMENVCWDDPWLTATLPKGTPGFHIFNNVLVCSTPFASVEGNVAPNFISDYNLYTAAATDAFPQEESDRHSLFGGSPAFVDMTNGNWRLAAGSPGKGAGCAPSAFCPALPSELAGRADAAGLDMGLADLASDARTPLGPVSGLWELARKSINLGERDGARFSLDPARFVPLRPLWGTGVPGTGSLEPQSVMPPNPPRAERTPTPALTRTGDLLRNGSFTTISENGGLPADWTLSGAAELSLEKTGDENRLKLTIVRASSEQGSLAQTIAGLPADTQLVLSGKIRGSKDGGAYLQVKLKDGKQEVGRFSSGKCGTGEKELQIAFSTGNASAVSVQCRFSQETAGETVWLSNLTLKTDEMKAQGEK